MKKEAIENIKAAFAANPEVNELHVNAFGHCFKKGGEGLNPVKREEIDSLKADEDGEPEGGGEEGGGSEGTSGKKGKKK